MERFRGEHRAIEFYDVKSRQKVSIDESNVRKVVYHPGGETGAPRFAVRAEHNGSRLIKFISKATYEALAVPEG